MVNLKHADASSNGGVEGFAGGCEGNGYFFVGGLENGFAKAVGFGANGENEFGWEGG